MRSRALFALGVALIVVSHAAAAASAPQWVVAAAAEKLPELPKDTDAVVLLDETVFTVLPSGGVTTQYRRAVRVLTAKGKGYAYGVAGFDGSTKLRGLEGWSIDPAGKVSRIRGRHAVESSAADFEVYTDAKMKILDLPAEVGSVIAYQYSLSETPYEPVTTWTFQESIPVRRARFTVVLPPGWKHEDTWRNHAPVEPVNGVWELLDVPAIKDEPRMPEVGALAGRLGVQWLPPSTAGKRPWAEVARWYSGLAAPRLASTPQLQQQVRTLTEGAADPVHALARFAQLDVRYVAVAIGIGGYQPHAAAETLANRYGDCKDKATLLQTMLREKGIASHYVIVNTSPGMVDPAFPTISAFNHVITAIRLPKETTKTFPAAIEHPQLGRLLLFDPTSTTTPFGHLPSYLQGNRGLLVTDDGGELIELPSSVPESNELRRIAKLSMDLQGTLHGEVVETRTGEVAAESRRWLQPLSQQERVQALESSIGRSLAHYRTSAMTIEQLEEPELPLTVKYEITVPAYANQVADMILIRPRVIGAKGENLIDMKERRYSYVTDGVSLHTDEVDIALPSGIRLDELPKPLALSTPHIEYKSSSGFENGVLRYRRRYAMRTLSVTKDAIPELNAAFAKIAADERASAVFK